MRTVTADDITQEQFDEAADLLINTIRSKYPKLDLRAGTVLRDLLVDADATVGAWQKAQVNEYVKSSSLKILREREESGEAIDADDVNAILSNFNMSSTTGRAAYGKVRVNVSSDNSCTLGKGMTFRTANGIQFSVDSDIAANITPSAGEVKLYRGVTGFYFVTPVTCTSNGSSGNIKHGTPLEYDGSIYNLVSCSAFGDFSGGSDTENLGATIERIGSSLSHRGMTSREAAEAQLRDRFDTGEHPIISVSVCGFGNPAQRRDKHNVLGVAVGGRADLYVRNFTELPIRTLDIQGKYSAETGDYTVDVLPSEIPGIYSVQSVTDAGSDAISSYMFSAEYTGVGLNDTWHDIDISYNSGEPCGTVWRGVKLHISVPGDPEPEKAFRVSVIAAPQIREIQEFVDSPETRGIMSDFVVRTPMICQVTVNAVARYTVGNPFSISDVQNAVCSYINTSGFPGKITRSEISSVMMEHGVKSVDLHSSGMLSGFAYDSFGKVHRFSGDSIDLSSHRYAEGMLTEDTCVFVASPENILITPVAE